MNHMTAAGLTGNRRQSGSRARIFLILVAVIFFAAIATEVAAVPRKIRVSDPVVAQQLVERGGKVLADYDGFKIVAAEDDVVLEQQLRQGELQDVADYVQLNAQKINTRGIAKQRARSTQATIHELQLHLIQFVGPIKPEWREQLEKHGVEVVTYIPANAYLIRGDVLTLARVQAWAATTDYVQWDDAYAAEYKIQPGTRAQESWSTTMDADDVFAVQLIEDAEATPVTLALIEGIRVQPIERDFRVLQYRNIIVRLPTDRLDELSTRPDVVSIQCYQQPGKRDERQAQILAGNFLGSQPSGPGYLEWLAERGFTQAQFDASGFVVDVSDSGIDNGTAAPGHISLYRRADPMFGSRVAYNRLVGTPHSASTLAGCDGHGNLNAHILAGFSEGNSGFPHADSAGYQYGLGVCPFVRVGSSVVFDPDVFTSPDYVELQSRAYQDGARISANSWGATNNTYTVDAQAYDALVRDAQPDGAVFAAPGNQEMVILFAAGNRGNAANSVGSPGTAKNVITVGASENVRSLNIANGGKSAMGSDGGGYTDASADNATDVATFSSRGPCSDGRQKPDLIAPGTHIVGGAPQNMPTAAGLGSALSCFKASSILALSGGGTAGSTNNFFPLGQQYYTVSSGTSHATPAVAGACALVRQYFLNHGLNAPSPAMTKAYLMNSTRFLTGAGANDNLWSPSQGLGAVNLGRAFDDVPRVSRDQKGEDIFTASGQARVFTARIAQTNQPFRVTLAWTDAPGSTTGNAFNNDLDLTVRVGTNLYLGNVFSGPNSVPNGSADMRNNVESVLLPAGVSGDVVVTVTAANVNSDGVPNWGGQLDQDFALVVYNATNTTVPMIEPAGTALIEEGFYPTNQAVDPGEMVTLQVNLKNVGTRATTNLQVTLLATNGVSNPSAAMVYGTLPMNGVAEGRAFSFIAQGEPGSWIAPTFQLHDAVGDLGLISFSLPLGKRVIETYQFTNATPFVIPDSGAASPYPSAIVVAGLTGVVKSVTATLRGYTHSWPDDVDVLLVGPNGQKVMLMSDCGGGNARKGITLTFDDAATNSVSDNGAIPAGTYKPTNFDNTTDNFAAPAPVGPYGKTLDALNGSDPNGTWYLFIQDDSAMDGGSLAQGWSLNVTTSNLTYVSAGESFSDLKITTQASTNLVAAWSNFTWTVTVTNAGSLPAAYTVVTNNFPAGYILDSAEVSRGSWAQTGAVGLWTIGMLNPGSVVSAVFNGRSALGGNFTSIATVHSFTPDIRNADNIVEWEISVVKGAGPDEPVINSNTPPILATLVDHAVHAGSRIHFIAQVTNTNAPTHDLSYSLLGGPMGASIDSYSGEFLWQTLDDNANTTNLITIRVADTGTPPLTDVGEFHVIVLPRPFMTDIALRDAAVVVSWTAIVGQSYQLQATTNLVAGQWEAITPVIQAANGVISYTNTVPLQTHQFYRVSVLP